MENAPLTYTNAHIYQRQKEIRQDMDRARISSQAFSSKMQELFSLFNTALKRSRTPQGTRISRRLVKE